MGGQVQPQSALFAKGKNYVEIAEVAANPEADHTATMQAFVEKMRERLEGRESAPEALEWFPKENLASVRLMIDTFHINIEEKDVLAPLAGIRAMSEAIEDGLAPDDGLYLRRISAEATRTTEMVDDMLALSRLQRGEKIDPFENRNAFAQGTRTQDQRIFRWRGGAATAVSSCRPLGR